MATYFFETIMAARALSLVAGDFCFASDGADDPGAFGGGASGEGGAGAAPPAAAEPAARSTRGPKLVKAIVRRGTVVVGEHGKERHIGPGGEVVLPEDDVADLRSRGVLHDPESPPTYDLGPTVDNDLTEPKVIERKAAPRATRKR